MADKEKPPKFIEATEEEVEAWEAFAIENDTLRRMMDALRPMAKSQAIRNQEMWEKAKTLHPEIDLDWVWSFDHLKKGYMRQRRDYTRWLNDD